LRYPSSPGSGGDRPMSVLSIRGLGKNYGAVTALIGLDLDIEESTRTAIVGPSGSGKTTLLRLIAGFEAPGAGEITIDGAKVADAAAGVPAHKRNVGLVMQEGVLFPHLSILDNIRFGIRNAPDSRERALELLDLVELDRSMAERQPHQISGGQQQRVALARALARKPRLMLLDEPFSALDTALRDHMREATVRVLAAANVATMLVTHDQDEAMSFADQLVVLRDGKLVQSGRPRDVYASPVDLATATFLGPSIVLDGDVRDGLAHCVLGTLPLRNDQRLPPGQAKVLLRPEQVSLVTSADGRSMWTVRAIRQTGSFVRMTLSRDDGDPMSLVTMARDIPPIGTKVSVIVVGAAHRLR
jgi:iron(III) transport system ATP-binding protein